MHRRVGPIPPFTLLELILVMAIVAIIVAMASPMLRGFGEARRADNCAAELVALTTGPAPRRSPAARRSGSTSTRTAAPTG